MAGSRPSPDRLLLRGYGPLAALLVVLLVVVVALPSRTPRPVQVVSPSGQAGTGAPGDATAGRPGTSTGTAAAASPRPAPGTRPGGAATKRHDPTWRPAGPRPATERPAGAPAGALPAVRGAGGAAPAGVRPAGTCAGKTRQDVSAYAPTCLTFAGDNGGATYRGVDKATITVALRESGTAQRLADSDSDLAKKARESGIVADPAATQRTFDTLLAYFNSRYQLYGRQVKVVRFAGRGDSQKELAGGGQEAANADALKVAQEIKAFAALSATTQPYLDALVRQQVLTFGGAHLPADYYSARAPYAWGQLVDCTTLMTSFVDLIAKRFPPTGNATRAGSAKLRGSPRTYGLIVPDDAVYAGCIDAARPRLKAAGITIAKQIRYALDFTKLQQEAPNMAAQLKAAKVTSVLLVTDPLLPFFLTGAATQQDFWPEWLVSGTAGTDVDLAGQFYDPDQWQYAYGQSYLSGLSETTKTGEGYRAYKSIRPDDEPTSQVELTYQSLLMLFIGLQQAGPDLTPHTYTQGMYAYPAHQGPYGRWSFSPTDHTPTDDAREIYYDPKAISPFNNKPGHWTALHDGRRYTGPTWPPKPPPAPTPNPAAP